MVPNWFERHIPTFEKHLADLAGKPHISACQIGAYAGHASAWIADNVLTGKDSWLYDVDTWEGSDDESPLDWRHVIWEYMQNRYQRPVRTYWMTSDQFCMTLPPQVLIYINA